MMQFVSGSKNPLRLAQRSVVLSRKVLGSVKRNGVRTTGAVIARKLKSKLLGLPATEEAVPEFALPPAGPILEQYRAWSVGSGYRPEFQLILPLSEHAAKTISDSVQSVLRQVYPQWSLSIISRPDVPSQVQAALEKWTKQDTRIRVCWTEGPSPEQSLHLGLENSNGGYCAILREGDQLRVDALFHLGHALADNPEHDILYTDEAHLSARDSRPKAVLLKPDWSPEMLMGYNYLGSLCAIRREILDEVGGFNPVYGDAQEWDLSLRLMEGDYHFHRVPQCCYYRKAKPADRQENGWVLPKTTTNSLRVLDDFLARRGWSATAKACKNGVHRVRWNLPKQPLVSIVIPNKNCGQLLRALVEDLHDNTDYAAKEIIVVDNQSSDEDVLEFYREQTQLGRIRVVPFNREFNYSAACNAGANAATGDVLLFMNNDMQVKSPDWLEELVGWAMRPECGVVGTKLLYPNGHLQHVGVVAGLHFVTHISHKAAEVQWNCFGTHDSYKNYLAVTGACQMIRREIFEDIGGFDESYALIGSDIILCLKARENGYRTVYTPHAALVHFEEYSRGRSVPIEDMERLARDIRSSGLEEDPYLHPQLHPLNFEPKLRSVSDPSPREMLASQIARYLPADDQFQPAPWFDDRAMLHQVACWGVGFSLPTYSPNEVAHQFEEAAKFVLHVLRNHPEIRARFPLALSEGKDGAFCRWLCSEGLKQFRIPQESAAQIREVFAKNPGIRIRQLFSIRADLRRDFPTALLPTGQNRFLRWMLEYGRREHGFVDHQVWWFFLETSEDPVREFGFTYSVLQDWQRNFPAGLTRFGKERLLNWLKTSHRFSQDLIEAIRSHRYVADGDETQLAFSYSRHWKSKFPKAFQDREQTQELFCWLNDQAQEEIESVALPITSPAVQPPEQGGINLLAHFCYPSGLQQSARSIQRSLEIANVPLATRDVPAHFNIDDPHREDLGFEVHDVSLIHVQPIPTTEDQFTERVYSLAGLEPRSDVYRIGYWYWELEEVPTTWMNASKEVQELWAPTRFISDAIQKSLPAKVTPMLPGVKIGAVESVDRKDFGIQDDEYFFLFMFDMKSMMERKNPLGLIEAYRKAFRRDDKAKLLIKVSSGQFNRDEFHRLQKAASDAGVLLLDDVLSREKSYGLIEACDCYVSLHRSEGLGLTMAEAMLLGKPVIATNYSGNCDFMTDECSMLVDYRLRELRGTCPDYVYAVYKEHNHWAHPSADHAASWMRWAYENQDQARQMGIKAEQHASEVLSLEAAARRLTTRLGEIHDSLQSKKAPRAICSAA